LVRKLQLSTPERYHHILEIDCTFQNSCVF
jgi:hypothetical protein